MSYNDLNYPARSAVGSPIESPLIQNREIIPNLRAQRQELVARIQKIDSLLQILEKNPDFIKMLDLTRELI